MVLQVGWQLQLARFLAPFMTIYTILQMSAIIFREQLELFRMHFLKDHIVICSLGRKGYLLAKAFRSRGGRVVVIERDTGNDFIVQCRQHNIMVLTGNTTDLALLRQGKVNQSRNVICICGDSVNEDVELLQQSVLFHVSGLQLLPWKVYCETE
jgi:hypothetical protein